MEQHVPTNVFFWKERVYKKVFNYGSGQEMCFQIKVKEERPKVGLKASALQIGKVLLYYWLVEWNMEDHRKYFLSWMGK